MSTSIPSSMKAWQYTQVTGGVEKNLKLHNAIPLPPKAKSLGPDEILVNVLSAALNPIDYKLAELPIFGKLALGSPASPGFDYAGRVAATGSNSEKDLTVGQMVFGKLADPTKYGTLAEYTIATRNGCFPLPEGVSPEDGACIGTAGITAYLSIASFVKAGDRVFINGGSGGVGVFTIQIAKILGCYVVTSCSSKNIALCKSLGADEVVPYDKQDVLAELERTQSFDLLIDNVGPDPLYYQAQRILKEGATFVLVGGTPSLALGIDLMKRFLWPGFLGGGQRKLKFIMSANDVEGFKKLAQWVGEGKLKIITDEVFGIEDKGPIRAFEKLKTGRAKGKIVVRVAAS